MNTIGIGSIVQLKKPQHNQLTGKLVDIYVMRAAAGNIRIKFVVQLKHNRTKSKTVNLALELSNIDTNNLI